MQSAWLWVCLCDRAKCILNSLYTHASFVCVPAHAASAHTRTHHMHAPHAHIEMYHWDYTSLPSAWTRTHTHRVTLSITYLSQVQHTHTHAPHARVLACAKTYMLFESAWHKFQTIAERTRAARTCILCACIWVVAAVAANRRRRELFEMCIICGERASAVAIRNSARAHACCGAPAENQRKIITAEWWWN